MVVPFLPLNNSIVSRSLTKMGFENGRQAVMTPRVGSRHIMNAAIEPLSRVSDP